MTTFSDRYRAHLGSPAWRLLKTIVINRADHRCQVCGMFSKVLEVHHKTYARLGHESLDDLLVVCPECHEKKELKKRSAKLKRMTTWAENYVPDWRNKKPELLEAEYDKFVRRQARSRGSNAYAR